MTTRRDRVLAYYSSFDEWSRLDSPEGSIEFERTWEVLAQHLVPGSRVLDLGGGPGRYAAELARRGHRVILADVVPALLDAARRRFAQFDFRSNIESIDEVNAEDLSRYADDSFDAVLALGPFYHLTSEEERTRAAREIYRVLRSGCMAFVALIPRISGIVGLIERAADRPEQVSPAVLRTVADTGVFRNPSTAGFQEGYYPVPGELEKLFESLGFKILDSLSLKSIADRLGSEVICLDTLMKAEVARLVVQMSRRAEIVATSGHVLMIVQKSRTQPLPDEHP